MTFSNPTTSEDSTKPAEIILQQEAVNQEILRETDPAIIARKLERIAYHFARSSSIRVLAELMERRHQFSESNAEMMRQSILATLENMLTQLVGHTSDSVFSAMRYICFEAIDAQSPQEIRLGALQLIIDCKYLFVPAQHQAHWILQKLVTLPKHPFELIDTLLQIVAKTSEEPRIRLLAAHAVSLSACRENNVYITARVTKCLSETFNLTCEAYTRNEITKEDFQKLLPLSESIARAAAALKK
jgi:hypothetical protein